MPFMPFQVLDIWFRGLLALVLLALGIYLLQDWYRGTERPRTVQERAARAAYCRERHGMAEGSSQRRKSVACTIRWGDRGIARRHRSAAVGSRRRMVLESDATKQQRRCSENVGGRSRPAHRSVGRDATFGRTDLRAGFRSCSRNRISAADILSLTGGTRHKTDRASREIVSPWAGVGTAIATLTLRTGVCRRCLCSSLLLG